MIRKLIPTLVTLLLVLLTTNSNAYNTQSYVMLYNYTESELTLYVDGSNCGTVPACYSPSYIPAPYGLHKVEVYRPDGWKSTYKYCETSYSYPNAAVTFGNNDL